MARRRGPSDKERFGAYWFNMTATGNVTGPCFLYGVQVTLTASTATGIAVLADTTSTADVGAESTRWDLKFGSQGVSGQTLDYVPRQFMPPLYISRGLYFGASTGVNSMSVQYFPAS